MNFVELKLGFVGINRNDFPSLAFNSLNDINNPISCTSSLISLNLINKGNNPPVDFVQGSRLCFANLKTSQNLFKLDNSLIKCTGNQISSLVNSNRVSNNGGCSLTVEYEPVALGTRVRLPPSAFVGSRWVRLNENLILGGLTW